MAAAALSEGKNLPLRMESLDDLLALFRPGGRRDDDDDDEDFDN